ncbi:hypothetical protein [Streptomyces sp. R41]|uniref:Uncharacterized protein n=1 Tax=Streptomyces sp. R41 TaxID=3238632 RepID=A0AB39RLC6_9ACTN
MASDDDQRDRRPGVRRADQPVVGGCGGGPAGQWRGGGRDRADAARRRSARPHEPRPHEPRTRVELHVNELTGTMSWRTLAAPGGTARSGGPRARVTSRGAAPIPTHPAAVRAAVSVPVETLTADQLRHHLAQVGALRSRVAADVALGAHVPTAVAARMRSGSAPAAGHALTVERSSTARELTRRAPGQPTRTTPSPHTPTRPPAGPAPRR